MNYFKNLVHCQICGGNYNEKNNNGQYELICSRKKNYGKQRCNSPTIKQETLTDIISTHLSHEGKEFNISKLKLFVKTIEVSNERIKIIYRNGTYSELTESQYIV